MPADLSALRSRLLGDTLRYAPAVIIPAATAVVSVALFTRLLGTENYGLYSVAAAAVSIATIVAAEWIGQSVLRYLPDAGEPSRAREVVGDALGLVTATVLVLSILVAFAHIAVAPGRGTEARALMLPAAALLVSEIAFTVLGAIMQARLQSRALSVFRVTGALLRLGMALGFVWFVAGGVSSLLAGASAGRALAVLAAVPFVVRDEGRWVRPRWDARSLRRFVGYGIPMVGWALSSQILGLSDRFVIGAFHGAGPVGIYSASYNLVTMGFGLLGGPLLMAAHPLIVGAWKLRGGRDMPEVIAAYSRPYIVAVVPALVVLVLCSHDVVSLILPGEFREGSRIVPVLALGSLTWGFAMYGHKGLELAERTRLMFVLVSACALLNVILNLLFVPHLGYAAAAWTTLVSNAAYPVLVHAASRRIIPWLIPWGTVLRVAAAAALAGALGAFAGRAIADRGFLAHLLVVSVVTLAVYVTIIVAWTRLRRGEKGVGA